MPPRLFSAIALRVEEYNLVIESSLAMRPFPGMTFLTYLNLFPDSKNINNVVPFKT